MAITFFDQETQEKIKAMLVNEDKTDLIESFIKTLNSVQVALEV